MRLWHKSLIPYLPNQQLLGQWRECCCIAKNISENGTPNHILVNKIMDYTIEDFVRYGIEVSSVMRHRGYHVDIGKFTRYFDDSIVEEVFKYFHGIPMCDVFPEWHNDRYLRQCLYNLQEKADCNGVSEEEWAKITDHFVVMG